MRIALILTLLLATNLTSWSQNPEPTDALNTTWVVLQARRMPLPQAFRSIQQKTGLLFVYQPGLVDVYNDVQVPEGRFTVAAALDSVIKGTYLDYTESNRNIIVFKKPILLAVRGYVKDAATGEPLPGANILVKDTERMTQTDVNGKYEIGALSDDILVVSFSGMLTSEGKVNNSTKVDFDLKPVTLEPVTVNGGYYQVSHIEQTGNIASTKRAAIVRQPVSNPLQTMQVSMPGVFVQALSGLPGSGIEVEIRDPGSLRKAKRPLFLVDGIPYPAQSLSSVLSSGLVIPNSSSMGGVSPAMIESIDVLKDADATAIYGSRGANGVVLITTMRQHKFDPGFGIDMNVNSGISQVANYVELLQRDQWLDMRREAFANDKSTPNKVNAPDLLLWDTTRNTNWQKKLIGNTAKFADASIAVHGGSDQLRVYAAYNINKQTNVFPGTFNYTRGSGLLNIQVSPENEKLQFSSSINYSVEENELPTIDLTKEAMSLSPVAPNIYSSEDDLNWENGTWLNPYANLRNRLSVSAKYFLASSQASYPIFRSVRVKVNAGFTNIDRQEINLNRISSQNPVNPEKPITGTQIRSNVSSSTWIAEPQLEYKKDFNWGKVTMLFGSTFQRSKQQGATLVGYGYTSDATLESMPSAPLIESYEPSDIEYSYGSLFARLGYSYQGRYLLNLTGRRDESSRFAPGMIGKFGAVGAAWIFSREKFASGWEFLEHGKVRVSYGTVGNDQIDDYGYLDSYATTELTYGGQSGIYPTRIANSKYSWELSRKFETGLQLGFLTNHVMLELSYYRNNSTNQLLGRHLGATTGFETVQYNLPVKVRSTGLEVSVDALFVNTANVRWTSNLNMTFPKNKLVRYDNINESTDDRKYTVGESINVLKRYKYLGIDNETGNFLYDDRNGDSRFDAFDLQSTKQNGPHWYGALENTITYKSFQLSLTLQYVNQTRQSLFKQFSVPGSNRTNQPVSVMDRWQSPGDNIEGHRFTQNVSGIREYMEGQTFGENGFADASYMRIKNLSISYTIPADLSERIKLTSSSIFIRSQNILTITNYPGLDPENADINVVPPVRTITIGVQLKL